MNHLEMEHDIDRLLYSHLPVLYCCANLLNLSHLVYLAIRVTTSSKCSKSEERKEFTKLLWRLYLLCVYCPAKNMSQFRG